MLIKHGTRVWFTLGTDVNFPSIHTRNRAQSLHSSTAWCYGTWSTHCLKATLLCASAQVPVLIIEWEHSLNCSRTLSYSHLIIIRVWKGILEIQDLIKIWCENRENDKYLDGIWDLTTPREAQDFFACLLGIREIVTTQINVLAGQSRWCLFLNQAIEYAWLILS